MLSLSPSRILTPEGFRSGWSITVRDGRIDRLGPAGSDPAAELEESDLTLVPGFIDLQYNGGFDVHISDRPEGLWEAAAGLPRYGVTSFLPTVITSAAATTSRVLEVFQAGPPVDYRGAQACGLHFEGPFLAEKKIGVHDLDHRRDPDLEEVRDWTRDKGVALVTLAPELPGAADVIAALVENGVVVSAGHSTADYDEAMKAFDRGVSYVTHLFNAMPPLHHRAPGLALAALERDEITVGLIPDGIHVHPALLAHVWNCKKKQRINLVTDAMSAMGMPPGAYRMGRFDIDVDETSARRRDGTLAGSVLTLDRALSNMLSFCEADLEEAVATVTSVPADLLGLESGRIQPGAPADFVLLDDQNDVVATIIAGRVAFDRRQAPGE